MLTGRFRRRKKVVEDSSKKKPAEMLDRLKSTSFPPAAVAGALVSFAGAALGMQAKPKAQRGEAVTLVQVATPSNTAPVPAQSRLEIQYSQTSVVQTRLQRSLSGIAIGPADKIFVLGDGEVRIFARDGAAVRNWKTPVGASCIAVDGKDRIFLGAAGRVEVFGVEGNHKEGFFAGEPGKPADVTAIRVLAKEILAADAAARIIRRFSYDGKPLGAIGTQLKTGGFMLPNHSLDIDVDSRGVIIAADTGRHRVSSWMLDGTAIRHFGKFGLLNPEDFVGCCNPVNLAFTPDGKIVTAEKVIPRIKVYTTEGKLLALIGPEHFDPKCTRLHLAIDSKGRILVADPVRLEVKVFSAAHKSGSLESV